MSPATHTPVPPVPIVPVPIVPVALLLIQHFYQHYLLLKKALVSTSFYVYVIDAMINCDDNGYSSFCNLLIG